MNKTKFIKIPTRNITEKESEGSLFVNVEEFKYLLGALLYIAIKSRPNISFAVNLASRHCEEPSEVNYKLLMNILKYLKCPKNKSIYYNRNSEFIGYSD